MNGPTSGMVVVVAAFLAQAAFLLGSGAPGGNIALLIWCCGGWVAALVLPRDWSRGRERMLSTMAVTSLTNVLVAVPSRETGWALLVVRIAAVLLVGLVVFLRPVPMTDRAGASTRLLRAGVLFLGLAAASLVIERIPGQRLSDYNALPVKGPVPDAVLGHTWLPNSVARSYFGSNPSGDFDSLSAAQSQWRLALHETGNVASVDFPPGSPERLRVRIMRVRGDTEWAIQLNSSAIALQAGVRYELRFRARADARRTISAGVARAHAPWTALGLYRRIQLDTTWQVFAESFTAEASDDTARMLFDLGGSSIAVDLDRVSLVHAISGEPVPIHVPNMYSVTYRFNSLGCRGPEPSVRLGRNNRRVLVLGDAYAMGLGVRERDMMGTRLSQSLNETLPDSTVVTDVMTCAVPGFGTHQERLWFQRLQRRYVPQVVILAMSSNDDRLRRADGLLPYELLSGWEESLVYYWDLVPGAADPDRVPAHGNAWPIATELRRLADDVQAAGARMVVLVFATGSGPGWDGLREEVRRGLAGRQVPVLDLGDHLPEGGRWVDWHVIPARDVRPNALAHAAAAEAVRRSLESSTTGSGTGELSRRRGH